MGSQARDGSGNVQLQWQRLPGDPEHLQAPGADPAGLKSRRRAGLGLSRASRGTVKGQSCGTLG